MNAGYRANKYSFLKRRRYEVAYGRELAALLRKVRPELVISANTPTEPQWALIGEASRMGIPVISWIQDFYSIAVEKLARKKLPVVGTIVGRWYRHLDKKCLRASAGIVAITEDFLPILAQFGVAPERVAVVPNWAPLEELPLRPRRNGWSAAHDLEDKFVFLYSGTLAMKHNPDLLLRLARQFRADPLVRIVVVSEGPGAEFLREQRRSLQLENLMLLPYQDFGAMPEVLASADVLVAVLEADAGVFSVPSKVLTYHCAARPILAAMPAENLATRIVDRAGSGVAVPPADVQGFVHAAGRLRADEEFRATLARNARAYAEREFDIGRIADRFETVIQMACDHRS